MAQKYQPNFQFIHEIYIKEIVFDYHADSSDVTIFGCYKNPDEEELQDVDYSCSFSTLTDILIAAQESGDAIINAIAASLHTPPKENPIVIDVENLFSKPLKIEDIVLTIYKPMVEDDNGELKELDAQEEFYFINHIESSKAFEDKQSARE